MRFLLTLSLGFLLVTGCGGKKRRLENADEGDETTQQPGHPDLRCPQNAEATGYSPPISTEVWCQTQLASGGWMKHGPTIQWRPDATKLAAGMYYENRQQGTWTFYFPEGQTERTETWDAGELSGDWVEFHPSGNVAIEGTMEEGLRGGDWTYWSSEGLREREGPFVDGEQHGIWIIYDEAGMPATRRTYRHGKLKAQQEL